MKLYGTAIAFHKLDWRKVEKSVYDSQMAVTCTVISVDENDLDNFEIVKELSLKTNVFWRNTQSVLDCLSKLLDIGESVIALQGRALHDNGLAYRPVSLIMGKDNEEVFSDKVFQSQLFPETKNILPPEEIQRISEIVPEPFRSKLKLDQKLLRSGRADRAYTHHLLPILLSEVTGISIKYFENLDSTGQHAVKEIYCRLATVLDQCYLKRGQFTKYSSSEEFDSVAKHYESGKNKENNELLVLKARLDACIPEAHQEIIDFAAREGKMHAQEALKRGQKEAEHTFMRLAPWNDYASSPEMQKRFPIFCYPKWHPDYRRAFNTAYREEFNTPLHMEQKFAGDLVQPFFTDPVAWMVRDQIDVARKRLPADVAATRDYEWRQKLIDAANARVQIPAL